MTALHTLPLEGNVMQNATLQFGQRIRGATTTLTRAVPTQCTHQAADECSPTGVDTELTIPQEIEETPWHQ